MDILSPVSVYKIKAKVVADITSESDKNKSYRTQLNRQLKTLDKGAKICKQFAFVKIVGKIAATGPTR